MNYNQKESTMESADFEVPPEMACLIRTGKYAAYLIDGRVRVFFQRTTYKTNKKTGERIPVYHSEQTWLSEWNPSAKSMQNAKDKIVAFVGELNGLSLTPVS